MGIDKLVAIVGLNAANLIANGGAITVFSRAGEEYLVSKNKIINKTRKKGTCILIDNRHYDTKSYEEILPEILTHMLSNKDFEAIINFPMDFSKNLEELSQDEMFKIGRCMGRAINEFRKPISEKLDAALQPFAEKIYKKVLEGSNENQSNAIIELVRIGAIRVV